MDLLTLVLPVLLYIIVPILIVRWLWILRRESREDRQILRGLQDRLERIEQMLVSQHRS
jgi:hypothetical protein